MTSSTWLILAATLAIVPYAAYAQTAASPPTLVTERTLSFHAAHEAATAALEQCHKDGYHVSLAREGASRARAKESFPDDSASSP